MTVPNQPGPIPVPFGPSGASSLIMGGDCLLAGWSFAESTGTASAECRILDGNDATGALAVVITLSAGQSTRDLAPGGGIWLRSGCFVQVVSGSVRGSLWLTDV